MAWNDKSKSDIFRAVLGGPWGKTDHTSHSGGGATRHSYSGPFDGWKSYHDHRAETWSKTGEHNSFTIHGLMIRDWKDK